MAESEIRPAARMNKAGSTIHLINPFWDAAGGAEARTINLYEAISPHRPVRLWTGNEADRRMADKFPLERIETGRLRFPKSGTFVFVGVYFDVGRWIYLARPRRIVLIYNTVQPDRLTMQINRLSRRAEVEIVYASEDLRKGVRIEGIFEPSLIDIDLFSPATRSGMEGFTIGRLSRSDDYKHHPGDADLYRILAARDCRVSLMGASPALVMRCRDVENISMIPTCSVPAADFLRGLDCFFYRTADEWHETWGRVVFEAMACGLPVVCQRRGGYAEFIDHGRNGMLFDSEEEALALLLALRDNPDLRRSLGKAARQTVEDLWSAERRSAIVDFYLK